MTTCKKATWLLTVREDRKLSQRERFELQLHLRECSLCRSYQWQTSLISSATRISPQVPDSGLEIERIKQIKASLATIK